MVGLRPIMAEYGVIKPQETWIHEHFHYALATRLGNQVNMFYRAICPYQLHVNRETGPCLCFRSLNSTNKSLS